MKVYRHYVIEWRCFQLTSILSYLRTKTKFSLLDLPASAYWSDQVSWNVLSLETSKISRHISKHYFMSLHWSKLKESVFKSVHVLKLVFKATPKYWHMLMTSKKWVFFSLCRGSRMWSNLLVTTDSIPLLDLRYRGNSISGVLSLIKPNFSCFLINLLHGTTGRVPEW